MVVERENGGSHTVHGHVTSRGGRGNHTWTSKEDLDGSLGKGCQKAERQQIITHATIAPCWELVPDDASAARGHTWRTACNEAGLINKDSTGVRDLHLGAIGNGLQKTKERDFMRSETGIRRRRRTNLGDLNRAAGQRSEDETVHKVLVGSEPERGLRR